MLGNKKTAIDQYIIAKVKAMRHKEGMSQSVLATKLEVSNAFIGQIEDPKHKSKYNTSHLNSLARIFNCSPKDFLPENPV